MTDLAWWSGNSYVVDGGVVLNEPVRPLLEAIPQQPAASASVRRVLLFVSPNPGTAVEDPIEKRADRPDFASTVAGIAQARIGQSIAEDLETVRRHNEQVLTQRGLKAAIVRMDASGLESMARHFGAHYAERRGREWANSLLTRLVRRRVYGDVVRLGASDPVEDELACLQRDSIWNAATEVGLPHGVLGFPSHWPFDRAPLDRGIRDMQWLLRNALREKLYDPSYSPAIEQLRSLLREAQGVLDTIARAEVDYWAKWMIANHPPAAEPLTDALKSSLHAHYDGMEAALSATLSATLGARPHDTYYDIARMLVVVASYIAALPPPITPGPKHPTSPFADEDVAALVTQQIANLTNELRTTAGSVGGIGVLARPQADVGPMLRRLVFVDIAYTPAMDAGAANDELIELVQVSARAENCFDRRHTPREKLTGLQLAHFGAFFKSSWRANDWMWGRLDASSQLVDCLLSREYVTRQVKFEGVEVVVAGIAGAALGISQDLLLELPALTADAIRAGNYERDAMEPLPADLDDLLRTVRQEVEAVTSANGPARLGDSARWVTRRLQLEILAEELPTVISRAVSDQHHLDEPIPDVTAFLAEAAASGIDVKTVAQSSATAVSIPPTKLVDLFRSCRIGEERIAGQLGSARFARTSTKATAVAVSAFTGTSAPGLVRPWLKGLRATSRLTAAVAQQVGKKGLGIGLFLVAIAVVVSGALVGVAVVSSEGWGLPGVSLALTLLAAVALMGLLRQPRVLGTAIIALVTVVAWTAAAFVAAVTTRSLLQVLAAIIAAVLVTGLAIGVGSLVFGPFAPRRLLGVVIMLALAALAGAAIVFAYRGIDITTGKDADACTGPSVWVRPDRLCVSVTDHPAARLALLSAGALLLALVVGYLVTSLIKRARGQAANPVQFVAKRDGGFTATWSDAYVLIEDLEIETYDRHGKWRAVDEAVGRYTTPHYGRRGLRYRFAPGDRWSTFEAAPGDPYPPV